MELTSEVYQNSLGTLFGFFIHNNTIEGFEVLFNSGLVYHTHQMAAFQSSPTLRELATATLSLDDLTVISSYTLPNTIIGECDWYN